MVAAGGAEEMSSLLAEQAEWVVEDAAPWAAAAASGSAAEAALAEARGVAVEMQVAVERGQAAKAVPVEHIGLCRTRTRRSVRWPAKQEQPTR